MSNGVSIKLPSPDGTVWVHCTEDKSGKLDLVIINIGKAGHSVSAWADALSRLITLSLKNSDLTDVIEQLSNITSGKAVYRQNYAHIRSAPDAIYRALLMYKNSKPVKDESRPARISIPADW